MPARKKPAAKKPAAKVEAPVESAKPAVDRGEIKRAIKAARAEVSRLGRAEEFSKAAVVHVELDKLEAIKAEIDAPSAVAPSWPIPTGGAA